MEKLKLTKEQAKAIQTIKSQSLRVLSAKDIYNALNYGYTVEPEFKVGDWVVNDNGAIGYIQEIKEDGYCKGMWWDRGNNVLMHCFPSVIKRHATPSEIAEEKERRWWKELGREVGEWKAGDIFINISGGSELYRPLMEVDRRTTIVHGPHLKMVCPAENRLDVKINE